LFKNVSCAMQSSGGLAVGDTNLSAQQQSRIAVGQTPVMGSVTLPSSAAISTSTTASGLFFTVVID
jgi:hypothetical protein